MNRRQFLAAGGGLSAAAQAVSARPALHPTDEPSFKTINLQADGLALTPREYVALLGKLVEERPPRPDYYSNGGAVEELERKFAQLLGKEAAIFVPTGTLANHLAVRKLAGAERRVLVPAESHLYNDSGDCAQTLSGLNLIPLAPGKATFEVAEVRSWVEASAGGRVPTPVGAIVIESPVRRRDHEMFDPGQMEQISSYARAHGIRLHLDGARMFSLPYHSGKSVREYASLFDTVYVSLWKHFNGAAGAILAGSDSFIQGLSHTRRMFGGSLPQAWPQIALIAQSAEAFADEYARAWKSADELIALFESDRRFKVQKLARGTSRFFLTIQGTVSAALTERLSQKSVVISHAQPDSGIIPVQINPTLLRTTPAALFRTIVSSL
ncbi:MAG: threonine aldolase family protein [Steroidobacteraceae bacterium]